MLTKLVQAHKLFIFKHPHFPLANLLRDDITQMESHELKSLDEKQQRFFCISLLWLIRDSLIKRNLSDSALGQHVSTTLKSLLRSFSTRQRLALEAEHAEWRKMETLNENEPTSVIR